jgi:phage gp36-like protein
MAYTTQAAIEGAIGVTDLEALSDVNGATAADVVAAAIAEADAIIDSYAHKRHAVPFATVPSTIAALSSRMAVRILRRDRRMVLAADIENETTDRKWLEALARGLVTVGVEPAPTADEATIDKAGERSATTKNVSRERLKGFW